jgi:hypothetical protein
VVSFLSHLIRSAALADVVGRREILPGACYIKDYKENAKLAKEVDFGHLYNMHTRR